MTGAVDYGALTNPIRHLLIWLPDSVIQSRYPAGLDSHDFQGLFGYKVFLVIAILMGEGLYMVLKVLYSCERGWRFGLRRWWEEGTRGRRGRGRAAAGDAVSSFGSC